jgi:hypothetical protein
MSCIEDAKTDGITVLSLSEQAIQPRGAKFILRLLSCSSDRAAANRVRAGPMDAQALVRIHAPALPDEERPIGLRSVRGKLDLGIFTVK